VVATLVYQYDGLKPLILDENESLEDLDKIIYTKYNNKQELLNSPAYNDRIGIYLYDYDIEDDSLDKGNVYLTYELNNINNINKLEPLYKNGLKPSKKDLSNYVKSNLADSIVAEDLVTSFNITKNDILKKTISDGIIANDSSKYQKYLTTWFTNYTDNENGYFYTRVVADHIKKAQDKSKIIVPIPKTFMKVGVING
jgi:hypothetical protein